MKSNFWLWVLVCGMALLCLALLDKSCNSEAKLVKAVSAKEEAERIDAADDARRDALEAKQNEVIAGKDKELAEKDVVISQYVGKTTALTAEITALQNAEPVQPELEKEPLVISLRAQVSKLTVAFSLSQNTVALQSEKIVLLEGKFDALKVIADARQASIVIKDDRIAKLEAAFNISEHSRKVNKFWVAVGKYAPPLTFILGVAVGK